MLYWSIWSSPSSADKVILASSPSPPITSILASPEAATRLRVLESKVNSDSPVIAAAQVAVTTRLSEPFANDTPADIPVKFEPSP